MLSKSHFGPAKVPKWIFIRPFLKPLKNSVSALKTAYVFVLRIEREAEAGKALLNALWKIGCHAKSKT